MEYKEIEAIVKKYEHDPEIKEALRWISSISYNRDKNKENFLKMIDKYHDLLKNQDDKLELGEDNSYFITEWSWSPLYDGRIVSENFIRQHLKIDGIDCYFTCTDNRIHFKEHIFDTRSEAEKACSWQNSFAYDYDTYINREKLIRDKLVRREICIKGKQRIVWGIKNV